jgi:hypothetical protein
MTSPPPADPARQLLDRVAATRDARDLAVAVHDQAIRDAKAAGHPVTQIAGTLGVNNRMRLYAVLDKPDENARPVTPTPVVFLRGAGAGESTWAAVETAMLRRGFAVVKDRQQAWNLARGGVPVVLVDFSATRPTATAGRVAAKWKPVPIRRTVGQLLPRNERDRLTAAGASWLDTPVTVEDRQPELPFADPAATRHVGNDPLDPDELARAAVAQLE